MINKIVLLNKEIIEKQMIYAPTKTDCACEQRDKDIMKSVTNGDSFFKFSANGIRGAENIKNDTHLWCDMNNNIYQICCGHVQDMNNNDIPDTFFVKIIGVWY